MIRGLVGAVLAVALTSSVGCSTIFGVDIEEQTVTAACGSCVFEETEGHGCYWAVEIDGEVYAVNGPVPKDHDSHAPDGMCSMSRQAVVAGELRGGQLMATKFELLPADPAKVPTTPAHTHAH